MQQAKIVAAILTAHHPSRWHYRQILRAQCLKDSPIPYKFVFSDPSHPDGWGITGIPCDEILYAPGPDDKAHLHLKDQAACRWALDDGADFLWRAMCDTWWWPERLLNAGLEAFDYAGNWPCTLRLGGTFKVPMRYYDFFHGGCGIWLSRKAMQKIVDATWREDYISAWPAELDIGFGLTAPKIDYPWDDFWLGEVLKGELAWDDPLRSGPIEAYNAAGINLFEDSQLFVDDDPERPLSIHDPGVAKRNAAGKFDGLTNQVKQRNAAQARQAQAMRAARVPEAEIKEVSGV